MCVCGIPQASGAFLILGHWASLYAGRPFFFSFGGVSFLYVVRNEMMMTMLTKLMKNFFFFGLF